MRLVIWYLGEGSISADELLAKLPEDARLVDQQMPNIFLIEADEAAARRALGPSRDWTISPEQWGHAVHVADAV